MARREVVSRRWWWSAVAGGLSLLVAPRAEANVGLPMLVVLWPVAVIAFVPVVAVESTVARRVIGEPWRAAWKVSLLANLVTTAVGVPVTWALMLRLQLVGGCSPARHRKGSDGGAGARTGGRMPGWCCSGSASG